MPRRPHLWPRAHLASASSQHSSTRAQTSRVTRLQSGTTAKEPRCSLPPSASLTSNVRELLPTFVLRRRRRADDGGVHDRASAHLDALLIQVTVHRLEQRLAQ